MGGSSTMSMKELSAIAPNSMHERVNSLNSSSIMSMQSLNQRILNELTSDPKFSLAESAVSMTPSDLVVSRISRLSSGSFGRNSFGSLGWMEDEPPMDRSFEDILDEVVRVSQKQKGDENGQKENLN